MKSHEGEEQISEVVKALAGQSELSSTLTIGTPDLDKFPSASTSLPQEVKVSQSSVQRCETVALEYRKV